MRQLLQSVQQHPLVQRPVVRQFMKFGIVGVINTALDYLIYSALIIVFHVHFLAANAVSFSLAVTNSYVLNRRWTFRSDNPDWKKEATKFFLVNLVGLGLSEMFLKIFVHGLGVSPFIAKLMAVVIVLGWNFIGTRLWAFRTPLRDLPG